MAGNPDQQEDTPDDQYQEEMEDEVSKKKLFFLSNKITSHHIFENNVAVCVVKAQEDVTGGQKKDGEVEEDPYNEENLEQVWNQKLNI